jgi:hypothetical protein
VKWIVGIVCLFLSVSGFCRPMTLSVSPLWFGLGGSWNTRFLAEVGFLEKHSIVASANFSEDTYPFPRPFKAYGKGVGLYYRYYLKKVIESSWLSEVGLNLFHGVVRTPGDEVQKTVRELTFSAGRREYFKKNFFFEGTFGYLWRSQEVTLKAPSKSKPSKYEEGGYSSFSANITFSLGYLF